MKKPKKKKEIPLPPLDCEYGFYKETVEKFLNELGLNPDLFWKWMYGQTMAYIEGKYIVYPYDLGRYVNVAAHNTPILD